MWIDFYLGTKKYASSAADQELARIPVKVPAEKGLLQLRFSLPILDFHGYWTPETRTPTTKIVWTIEANSAAQRNFPYLAFFNSKQENRASVSLTDLRDDAKILAKMNQETCCYDITISVALSAETRDFELVVDRRNLPWTQVLGEWSRSLDVPKITYPDAAWEPVFCTWYAVHAAVTQDWVEANAKIASELGFGTLIIDDGWCFDVMKRVSPETIGSWYEMIGDWLVSAKKFPDFINHVGRIHSFGMKYMLWVAPFLIGEKSELCTRIKEATYRKYNEGCYTFDSKNEKEAQELLDKMGALMENYPIDGLKVDFLDHIFPNLEEPRGCETFHFIRRLAERIRAAKSDALIEFRQSYATPGMLPYGTQFRAGDVPFDFTDNFFRLAQIRVGIGNAAPVHADPVYWHPQESPVNISRHMIASLAGVPMLSMDMEKLSKTEKEIIAHWIGFYKEHLDIFRNGKWDVSYHQSGTSWVMATHGSQSVIILHDDARLVQALEKAAKHVFILNLSPEALPVPGASAFDCTGRAVRPGVVPTGGLGVI